MCTISRPAPLSLSLTHTHTGLTISCVADPAVHPLQRNRTAASAGLASAVIALAGARVTALVAVWASSQLCNHASHHTCLVDGTLLVGHLTACPTGSARRTARSAVKRARCTS